MKVRNWPLVMISIYIFIITGCSIGLENEEQRIEVHKNIGDNEYEDFKVVTDNNEVMQVKKILKDTTFLKIKKVEMSRPADYHFVFQFKNPKIEAKAVLYQIWISPNKDKVEIISGGNRYAQLEEKMRLLCFGLLQGKS